MQLYEIDFSAGSGVLMEGTGLVARAIAAIAA